MVMDERRLEVFVAVARRLNFSNAARALRLSQPAVSQQVAALERELGAQLFERTTRRVRLTAAGATLLAYSETLLREHAAARRAVAAAEGRITGDLSVAASLTVGAYLLPAALVRLAVGHPELRARVTIENTQQVAASVLEGRADVGFVEGELDMPELLLHPLREDELVIIAPVGHRFGAFQEVPLDELLHEPFVLRERGSGTRQVAETYLREEGVDLDELRVVAELSGIDAIKAAVAAGLGISIISRSALPNGGVAWGLIFRRIDGIRLTRQLAAVTLRGTTPIPATRSLLAALGA
jgi:LysR family transcriptional regulator, transcriptional activator of the cysJI operon